MAAQASFLEATSPADIPPATINLPSEFQIISQDRRLKLDQKTNQLLSKAPAAAPPPAATPAAATPPPSLGVLSNFTGTFAGTGFNLIFRPNNGPNGTTFPIPVNPPPPTAPNENVLELNLIAETLSFSGTNALKTVPNRGLGPQEDITLSGVAYLQVVSDVSNTVTGKADAAPSGIHFEPGLWMDVPATTTDPVQGETLVRMGSIPHGTTINAQGLAPTSSIAGPPTIPAVDITPFVIGTTNKIPFASQTISANNTARLPQDLTKFIAAGTITQAILDDPNTVLRKENVGKTITKTTTFTVSTVPVAPGLGGGTANIAFLLGATAGANSGPNASAVQMSSTFWIEQVQYKITVPVHKPGQPPLKITPPAPHPGALVPTFLVNPPKEITKPTTIPVTSTQIQYSQNVDLNFSGLTWPHVSVATLIPQDAVPVPASAFK